MGKYTDYTMICDLVEKPEIKPKKDYEDYTKFANEEMAQSKYSFPHTLLIFYLCIE